MLKYLSNQSAIIGKHEVMENALYSTRIGFLLVCSHCIWLEVLRLLLGATGVNNVTLSVVTGGQVTLLRVKVVALKETECVCLVPSLSTQNRSSHRSLLEPQQ